MPAYPWHRVAAGRTLRRWNKSLVHLKKCSLRVVADASLDDLAVFVQHVQGQNPRRPGATRASRDSGRG